jgi:hypothetical protein
MDLLIVCCDEVNGFAEGVGAADGGLGFDSGLGFALIGPLVSTKSLKAAISDSFSTIMHNN